MKTIRVEVSTNKVGSEDHIEFEIEDDATEYEIEEIASERIWDLISWNWEEI